jgi:hypothetical protein
MVRKSAKVRAASQAVKKQNVSCIAQIFAVLPARQLGWQW